MPAGSDRENWPVVEGAVHPRKLQATLDDLRVHPNEIEAPAILPFIPDAAKIDQTKDRRLGKLTSLIAQTASIHAVATHLIENTRMGFDGGLLRRH
ncbi:MAG: hypothetical protein WDM76_01530 [Limisphaerales bacterium]